MSAPLIEIMSFFFLSLGLGLSACTPLVHSKMTGAGLQKVFLSVCFGSYALLLICLASSSATPLLLLFNLGLLACLSFRYFQLQERRGFLYWLPYFLEMILGICAAVWLLNTSLLPLTFFILTTGVLGTVMYTMLLGHWYLVTPKLSEKPLIVGTILFWCVLAAKLLLSAYSIESIFEDYFAQDAHSGFGYLFNWIVLSMRYLWGYLIIFVMSIFAWKLVRMRSIQSATGVFYVMVFFALVGELMSIAFYYEWGALL